ncbi:MAG: RNA polymerase sigma-70 factor (ECF subfamily) [Pseudohongiellaceae bacterium]
MLRLLFFNKLISGARLLATEEVDQAKEDVKNTDQQLVDRVFNGDKHAFDLLVLRYQQRILGLIGRFIRDPAEVEDVAQEAFIKAYRALPKFRGDSAFYTWLYRIAINTAKNYLVARGRRPPSTDIDVDDAEFMENNQALTDIGTPEANQEKEDLQRVINEALEDLPEDLRTAFTLREFSGLSYEEITEIMGCPVGTVRSRIFRAREALDKKIRPLLDNS